MLEKVNGIKGFEKLKEKALYEKKDLAGLIVSEQFRRFFMAYGKAINKQQEREGSLFKKYFKRKEINNLQYLQQLVCYIHRNPIHHGFDIDFSNYPWNSFIRMLEERITRLMKVEVINWFGDKDNYVFMHKQNHELPEDYLVE